MHLRPAATRLGLTLCLLAVSALAPAFGASAAQTNELLPAADGWTNAARPGKNHGLESKLKAYGSVWESYVRFDLTSWQGRAFSTFELQLSNVAGDASTLSAVATSTAWDEGTLNYRNRPAPLNEDAAHAQVSGGEVAFDLSEFFPQGSIMSDSLSLRVAASTDTLVRFGARESAAPPKLVIAARTNTDPVALTPYEDVHASAATPTANYATTPSLVVDGGPATEAFMSFDLSGWVGQSISGIELRLWLKDETGAGLSVYRIGAGWDETTVTWDTRPTGDEVLTTTFARTPAGPASLDLRSAFPSQVIDRQVLSVRLASTSTNGFVAWAREGAVPPQLVITPGDGSEPTPPPTPSPTPTRTPSPTPTAAPTRTPTSSPTPTPSATPTANPTPTPTPSPSPTPPAGERWVFRGFGTDHGVGMSQYGARGRAAAGQTYDQILAHYYSGTTLGNIPRDQVVRVLLASSYVPTANMPARITARNGSWSSPDFVSGTSPRIFPADSYAQMTAAADGWTVSVYGAGGGLLASAPAADMTMTGTDAATLFEMKWRDSLVKYDLYRGKMRLLGDPASASAGVSAINAVDMDDYLKGVVPAEMPPLWPIEAVKAQAVAARGYAFVRLKPGSIYDVRPTADNQVYGGVRLEHARSNQAVDATSTHIVMANGVPANTYFFTVGGGYTENNELAWVNNAGKVVSNPIAYLRGVPDLDANGQAYDRNAASYEWVSDSFTWAQLEQMLTADSRTNVGKLLDLRFERGVSGRIYRVTIIGNQRTVYVSGQMLKGIYNSHRLSGPTLKSSMLYLERAP